MPALPLQRLPPVCSTSASGDRDTWKHRPAPVCVLVLVLVTAGVQGSPWLWSLPFMLTFVGGVFADGFETPRRRSSLVAAVSIVAMQIIVCVEPRGKDVRIRLAVTWWAGSRTGLPAPDAARIHRIYPKMRVGSCPSGANLKGRNPTGVW